MLKRMKRVIPPTLVSVVVFCLVFNGVFFKVGAQPRPATTTTSGTTISVLTPETQRRLTTDRISKLKLLQTTSRVPVKVSLHDSSNSVELLQVNVPAAAGSTPQRAALLFLNDYMGLIDPRISTGELQPSAGSDGSCANGDTTFVRVVDGVPVTGGTITVRQSGGNIYQVENSLASVKGTIAPSRSLANLARHPLARDLRRNRRVDVAKLPQTKVLLPVENNSGGYLTRGIAYFGSDEKDRVSAVFYDVGSNKMLPGKWELDPGSITTPTIRLPKYRLDPRTGIPIFITYRPVGGLTFPPTLALDPVATVYSYFNTWPSVFRTGAPRCQFRVKSVVRYPYVRDTTFVRMEQIYVGLPVFGAELVFEIRNRTTVMSVMGHTLSNIYLDPIPKISGAEAVAKARDVLVNEYSTLNVVSKDWQRYVPQTTLVVFPGQLTRREKLGTHLAYRVAAMDFYVFIDAHDGAHLYSIPRRHSEAPGLNFIVNTPPAGSDEYGRLSYTEFSRNGVPSGTAGTADSAGATTLLPLVGAAYTTFGTSGIDGNGLDYIANTDVALSIGCPNAFYTDLVNEAFFCTGVAPNDVVAHEFTHGVIGHSSGLIYQDESGALNESYSDIMGNLIFPDTATLAPGVPAWLVGEAVPGGSFRDMANPVVATLGAYRARNIGAGAAGCTILANSCDSGFVHTNSGITNLAHVLLANGNAIPAGSIAIAGVRPGIGRIKTRHLAFLTMTTRLTPWSHLVDSELGTHETAEMLQSLGATPLLLAGEAAPGAFNQLDADVVPTFFAQVGLTADLSSGYASPQMGFNGTQTFFPGETTDNACPVTNIRVKV